MHFLLNVPFAFSNHSSRMPLISNQIQSTNIKPFQNQAIQTTLPLRQNALNGFKQTFQYPTPINKLLTLQTLKLDAL